MLRLHWDEVQPHLKVFPISDAEVKGALDKYGSYQAMERLSATAFKRHQLMGVNVNSLDPAQYAEYRRLTTNILGACRATVMYRVFGVTRGKIYKIAKDFGEELRDLKADVPPTVMTWDNQIYCIEFPDGMEFDLGDGDVARNCYVGMFKDDTAMGMDITVPLYEDGKFKGQDNIKLVLDAETDLADALTFSKRMTTLGNPSGITHEILTYIVNCMLYIQSGDPDLRHLKPVRKPSNIRDLKKWLKDEHARIPYPVTLVGFDFKKPREFQVGEAHVRSHRRWQRCGPELSKVKLTWVKAHTRHYGKLEGGEPLRE